MPDSGRVTPITIMGQQYPIRTSLDADYVIRLATFVDEKMRAVSESTPSGDSVRLAVLAALLAIILVAATVQLVLLT